MTTFATRYKNGEHDTVWEELRQVGKLKYPKAEKPVSRLPLLPWLGEDEDAEQLRELVADIRAVVAETMR